MFAGWTAVRRASHLGHLQLDDPARPGRLVPQPREEPILYCT